MPTLNSPTPSYSCHDDWQSSPGSSRSASYSSTTTTPPVSTQQARDMTLSELSTTKLYRMELKVYLTLFLEKEANHGTPSKRLTSRRKLSKLNHGQFMELARDVYDEMIRRTVHEMKDPFLPVHDEFHPRRNQARQKLATLPEHRFMDLSSDVYHELGRRYPHTKMEKNDALPPLPNSVVITNNTKNEWFSQTVVPEKGSIRIDSMDQQQEYHAYSVHPLDDDGQPLLDSSHTSSNWTDSLDSLIADIDSMVRPQSNNYLEGNTSRSNSKHSISDDRQQQHYEQQIQDLKQRIQELEDNALVHEEKCDRLEHENQQLLHQHRQQEEVVQKVKKEIVNLLQQLDTLSSKNGEILADRDQAYDKMDKLQDEVKEWQAKYNVLQRQLDGHDNEGDISNEDHTDIPTLIQPHGIIAYETVITYQAHVNELVKKSRTSQPANILPCINAIVMVCKHLSDQVDSMTEPIPDQLPIIRRQYSLALHHLLSASKGYVHGSGLYPLCLLHASTSHLTNVVIELIQLLGVCN
ncbi:hypothetical protein BC941DRAFT_470245 [Chlamydoabsidia padenii]|nr:hypothetical protein BC941DRAFT_470245 [Chlamydoabsidia padenii]